MTDQPLSPRRVAMTLPVDAYTGWGVYGLNLAMQSLSRGVVPVMLVPPEWKSLSPLQRAVLAHAEPARQEFARSAAKRTGQQIELDYPLLRSFGNQFEGTKFPWAIAGTRNIASVFLENPALSPQALEQAGSFDKIIAGSNWNGQVLQKHGLKNVAVVLQGVDPSLFHPAPRSGLWKNHFVIFSGGKLEYRKGQDLVVAALRKFCRTHTDAVLIFAWWNKNPQTMREIDRAGLVSGSPAALPDGRVGFGDWLQQHDIHRFVDLGPVLNWQIGPLTREADVALFPNRAEGGTNLVAMECMASGVPTILSANTGHLDIISDEVCYPLHNQGPCRATPWYSSIEGWGESSVDEIVETLERVYRDRDQAARHGAAAAEAMRQISWESQISKLLQEIG